MNDKKEPKKELKLEMSKLNRLRTNLKAGEGCPACHPQKPGTRPTLV